MTEPLEHYFGTARRYVKELDLFQFCQLTTKIATLMDLETSRKANEVKVPVKARAKQGYQHTYNEVEDIKLGALSTYPTDSQIAQISLDVSTVRASFERFSKE